MLSFYLNFRSHSKPNLVYSNFSNSQDATTVTQHSNIYFSLDFSKHLVVKEDGKRYTCNLTNSHVNKFPDGFFVRLDCSSNLHKVRDCKDHRVIKVRSVYWQELQAHVHNTRKKLALLLQKKSPLVMTPLLLLHLSSITRNLVFL